MKNKKYVRGTKIKSLASFVNQVLDGCDIQDDTSDGDAECILHDMK